MKLARFVFGAGITLAPLMAHAQSTTSWFAENDNTAACDTLPNGGIGPLACTDCARQGVRHDSRRRQAIITHDPAGCMDDHNNRKPLLLIGQCPRLQPVVK
jgi:hypothetical protein